MTVRYDFYDNPPQARNRENKCLHARVVGGKTVGTRELSADIHSRSSLTEGDVQSVLVSLKGLIREHLQNGNRVCIDGLGTFEMTLSCPAVGDVHEIRAESVSFRSVAFRPHKAFKDALCSTRFVRVGEKKHSGQYHAPEAEHRLAEYFKTNDFLSSRDFQVLFKLTKATANRRLKLLVGEGKLIRVGLFRFPVYQAGGKLAGVDLR